MMSLELGLGPEAAGVGCPDWAAAPRCVVEVWALPAPLRGRLGCQSREGRLGSHARLGSGHLPLLSR